MHPAMTPWRQAGLEYLFSESGLPAGLSLCLPEPARPRNAGRPPAPPAQRPAVERPAHTAPPRREQAEPPRPATTCQEPPRPAAFPETPALPPEHWPDHWRQRLAATRPGKILWTYWALGEDLCLVPDARRRELFRQMLEQLAFPPGTNTFWPPALPEPPDTTLTPDARIFWSAAERLRARAVVILGSRALNALEVPRRLKPFQQTRHRGFLLVVLPDPDFLLSDPHRCAAVREYLRQALHPFARQTDATPQR